MGRQVFNLAVETELFLLPLRGKPLGCKPWSHCGVVVPALSCTATTALPGGIWAQQCGSVWKGSGVGAQEAVPVKDKDKEALAMCADSDCVASDRNGHHRGSMKQCIGKLHFLG